MIWMFSDVKSSFESSVANVLTDTAPQCVPLVTLTDARKKGYFCCLFVCVYVCVFLHDGRHCTQFQTPEQRSAFISWR